DAPDSDDASAAVTSWHGSVVVLIPVLAGALGEAAELEAGDVFAVGEFELAQPAINSRARPPSRPKDFRNMEPISLEVLTGVDPEARRRNLGI
ncbi:MAG TPA: hypothetical protein VKF16_05405, partial [Candidatus Dormibacteraeota bacterium]|nr:hypothetical protein [Candidatus Dormibacteraeota bacterium]